MRASVCLAFCFAFLAGASHPADAQVLLHGRVLDDLSGQSLVGARVLLLNRYRKVIGYATTDRDGAFRFERRTSGVFRLEAKAIGYHEAITPLVWMTMDRDSARLEIRLTRHAVLLAPLEIVAMSPPRRSAVLENVEHRVSKGFGYHLTREDIEERRPMHLSDILVTVPGVYAEQQRPGSGGRNVYMRRALPGFRDGCPVQVFVDGILATRGDDWGGTIDDLVSPLDVEAIEVFRGLGSIPPEFLTREARCGVIAIWTRRSGRNTA